jgi:uncharacterized iron-regulated membrane protein
MKQATVRTWYQLHKWSSLVCTLFLLMLCVTGLPLIFWEEIYELSAPENEVVEVRPGTPPANLDRLIGRALERHPGEVPLFLGWDEDHPIVYVNTGARPDVPPAEMHTVMFHQYTGDLMEAPPFNQGVMWIFYMLHTEMYAGLPGKLFLGAMGFLFAVAIVSGVVLYAPFMRKVPFGTVRTSRSRRLKWLDLHNLLGIVTAMWAAIVTLTGVLNTLERPLYENWQAGQLARMTAPWQGLPSPQRFGSIEVAVAAAQAAVPDMQPAFVSYPGTGYSGSHHYGVFMQGSSELQRRTYRPVLVDAETSRFTATATWPAYMQALYLSQPLHFGDYGGLPLKILWALLTIVTIVVLGSGLYLWLGRHRRPVDLLVAEIESGGLIEAEAVRPAR